MDHPVPIAGLNEHFSGASSGTAFGYGIYFSDDAGKCDHYVARDEQPPNSDLHRRLYPAVAQGSDTGTGGGASTGFPRNVYYLVVCRVALGQPVRTQTAHDANMTSMDTGAAVFATKAGRRTQRELAVVAGLDPPIRHHALVAESRERGGPYRYREYVSFQSSFVYPDYLIAFQRCRAGRPL